MDQYFEYFMSKFGPVVDQQDASESVIKKYTGKLPNQLLIYWREIGWSGFAKGLWWIVNPEVWEEAMQEMLKGTGLLKIDNYHVITRNAFGDLWLWGEKTGSSVKIRSSSGMIFPNMPRPDFGVKGMNFEVQLFFCNEEVKAVDLLDDSPKSKPLFDRAYNKLGELKSSEVYGFVPLPSLGGSGELKYLQKLDAVTYMDILVQSTHMKLMPDYCAEARKSKN